VTIDRRHRNDGTVYFSTTLVHDSDVPGFIWQIADRRGRLHYFAAPTQRDPLTRSWYRVFRRRVARIDRHQQQIDRALRIRARRARRAVS
jgi:hypothetical protein